MSNGWQRNQRNQAGMQAFTHWFIIDEQWMAEKPGLQAFTHWFIIDSNGLQRNQACKLLHTGLL